MVANGALPDSALATTSGGKRLASAAAASYERTSAAFRRRFDKPLAFNAGATGYRSRADQEALYRLYGYPRAAVPGTSNHGLGLAGDFALVHGSDEWRWMNMTGREHGWHPLNESNLTFEPWHWVYAAADDQYRDEPTTEDDMALTDQIALGSEAAKALGRDKITVGGALQLAASAYPVAKQARAQVAALTGTVAALEKAIDALAAGKGVDPAAIKAAAKAGTKAALDEAEITVRLDTTP